MNTLSRAQKMHLFNTEEKKWLRNQIPVFNHVYVLCMCHEHLAQADGCKFNARRATYINVVYIFTLPFSAAAALSLPGVDVADKMLTNRMNVSMNECEYVCVCDNRLVTDGVAICCYCYCWCCCCCHCGCRYYCMSFTNAVIAIHLSILCAPNLNDQTNTNDDYSATTATTTKKLCHYKFLLKHQSLYEIM